jgi:hypothetical protein
VTAQKPVACVLAIVVLFSSVVADAMQTAQPAASTVVVNVVKRAARNGGGWVRLYMHDKRIISGRVMEARQDTFVLALDLTGIVEVFRYLDVKNVKGPPTHPMIKLGVIAGAAAGIFLLLPRLLVPRT